MGETAIDEETFWQYIDEIQSQYTWDKVKPSELTSDTEGLTHFSVSPFRL